MVKDSRRNRHFLVPGHPDPDPLTTADAPGPRTFADAATAAPAGMAARLTMASTGPPRSLIVATTLSISTPTILAAPSSQVDPADRSVDQRHVAARPHDGEDQPGQTGPASQIPAPSGGANPKRRRTRSSRRGAGRGSSGPRQVPSAPAGMASALNQSASCAELLALVRHSRLSPANSRLGLKRRIHVKLEGLGLIVRFGPASVVAITTYRRGGSPSEYERTPSRSATAS